MAAQAGGGLGRRRTKDAGRAAFMKANGIERTTQRCPVCYRIVACQSIKSNYNHICKG